MYLSSMCGKRNVLHWSRCGKRNLLHWSMGVKRNLLHWSMGGKRNLLHWSMGVKRNHGTHPWAGTRLHQDKLCEVMRDMHLAIMLTASYIYQASFDHEKVGLRPVLALHNLWRQIHKFLDILELRVENKTKYSAIIVMVKWSQTCRKRA